MTMMPDVDDVIRYEQGEMDVEETIVFFGKLVESGMAWQLQGSYGRTAKSLIVQGILSPDGTVHLDVLEDLREGRR